MEGTGVDHLKRMEGTGVGRHHHLHQEMEGTGVGLLLGVGTRRLPGGGVMRNRPWAPRLLRQAEGAVDTTLEARRFLVGTRLWMGEEGGA